MLEARRAPTTAAPPGVALALWPGRRPKLFEWQEKVSALPAAQRVRKEVMAGI